jgi:3-hydroxybutyryl-CoA dehydratase
VTIPVQVGESVQFHKTVGEADVVMFAGVTGDFARNHVDEEYMRATAYGTRIAHGVLVLSLASTASTMIADRIPGTVVSYGYDRVRFTDAVRLGDTVTITYTVASVDADRGRLASDVRAHTQDGRLCMVATHQMAVVPDTR